MSNEESTTNESRRSSALSFGVRTAILAGLILTPTAMAMTGTSAALNPPVLADGGHTTCCPPGPGDPR